MILPIYALGAKVLKQRASAIDSEHEALGELIASMWDTMYNANGVGLAAPQIGKSIRVFVVDTIQLEQEGEDHVGIKKVFINPTLIDTRGSDWSYEEGCLSIPKIRGDVMRAEIVEIEFQDQDFNTQREIFDGINGRVVLHEYDHLEGRLFTEQLKPVRRRLIRRKLEAIKKGQVDADYPMRFR